MTVDRFDPKVGAMFADPSGTEYEIMEERMADPNFFSQKSTKNRMEYKVRILKRGDKALHSAKVGQDRWVHVASINAMDLKPL